MCARHLQIGFWTRRELAEVRRELAQVFLGSTFTRQIVHRWESFHCSTPDGLYVDVSRTHTEERGDYDRPVVITLAYERAAADDKKVKEIASAVAQQLGIDVFVGSQTSPEAAPYDYDFRVRSTFHGKG